MPMTPARPNSAYNRDNEDTGRRLRVLFVPDSAYWVTGTIAKSIARFNPWIEATIASGPVIDAVFARDPALLNNFDLVHFTCPYASRAWLPRFSNLMPCVTSHHHVTEWDLIKHNIAGDAIVAGSPEWVDDLRNRGGDMSRVFYIPYGVDADLFTPCAATQRQATRARLKIPQKAIVVGFFGKHSSNDDDRKGLDVFKRAIVDLGGKLRNLVVVIVGPGWKGLSSALSTSGISCVWLPFVRKQSVMARLYGVLDFYWVTSRIEGGPVTLLEAMSSGVCSLTTPVGIAREIIRDAHNAYLVPFNDSDGFVERTIALAQAPIERQRIGRNARETILAEMDVRLTARKICVAYTKAFETYAKRLCCAQPVDVQTIAATYDGAPRSKRDDIPLNGFPVELHRRVRMLEGLTWGEHLILYHQQNGVAIKLILQEWLANPLSSMPPRVLLRRLLPATLVAHVLKWKNRSQARTHLLVED